MMILGYKLSQILFFFLIYCFLGWLIEEILYIVTDRPANRGFMFGPYGLSYGIGGVLVGVMAVNLAKDLWMQAVIILAISIVLAILSRIVIRILIGASLWHFSVPAVIAGAIFGFGVIVVQPMLEVIYGDMSIASAMILLILGYSLMVVWLVDGLADAVRLRGLLRRIDSYSPDGSGMMDVDQAMTELYPYRRWLHAYPHFREHVYELLTEEVEETPDIY